MTAQAARVISYPQAETGTQGAIRSEHVDANHQQDDFLTTLAQGGVDMERLRAEAQRVRGEITALKAENRWEDILALFHPVAEKLPELSAAGLELPVLREMAFGLGHAGRYDEAIAAYRMCLEREPDDFYHHAGMGYTLYDSLYAAKARQVMLHPAERKQRAEQAHLHFQAAQKLRPEAVTNFYRQGALYKQIQNKPEKALPLFETAVRNWRAYSEELRKARHQERKNYVKSLYQLASCLLDDRRPQQALERLRECLVEDQGSNYLSVVHKQFALGKILFQMGRTSEARQALELAAAQAKPEDDDFVFELLARTHLGEKNHDAAWKVLERVPQHRRRPYFRWTEADVLAARGEIQRARKVLEQAAERDRKGRHKALLRLIRLDFQAGDYQQCLVWAEQADQFFRQAYTNPCADALFWKAGALIRLERMDEARKTTAELEAFRPGYPFLPRLRELLKE
jgi:tetratricopeptide (TPR) repeat protein